MDLIWLCFMDIGVYVGLFYIRILGSGVLGMQGATGGIKARGLEALGSEGSGFRGKETLIS